MIVNVSLGSRRPQRGSRRISITLLLILSGALIATRTSPLIVAQSLSNKPVHGVERSDLDPSVSACGDFYRFANGGWIAKNPIPADYSQWRSTSILDEDNKTVLRQILEEAATHRLATDSPNVKQMGNYYASCMGTKRIESEGLKPLAPELQRIEGVRDLPSLVEQVARLHTMGVKALFNFTAASDMKDSSRIIAEASQGGVALPNRDDYVDADPTAVKLRQAYLQHIANMFVLLGDAPERARVEARTALEIETKLAVASMTLAERRNPEATYHKMTAEELARLGTNFSWSSYFRALGFPSIQEVNVRQPNFFRAVDQLLGVVPIADWKTYLRWHLIHAWAPAAPSSFVKQDFEFFSKTLYGDPENKPRWELCVEDTDRELGEVVGQEFVKRKFSQRDKERIQEMVGNLKAALRHNIEELSWMGPETKKQALEKLDAETIKIGFPDKWRDYSSFHAVEGPYVENYFRAQQFDLTYRLAQIGRPVDRTVWSVGTPATVDAYNTPRLNEIIFPAGILQPPYYDSAADDATNYGAIGAVIGHELTHTFDDQGRQYDARGSLRDWWAPEDLKNFQQRASCVQRQFDNFIVESDLHLNGALVLGEGIADLGGVTIAFAAFQQTLQGRHPELLINGFTPEQRFFLAWAHLWASNTRPEFAREWVKSNPTPLPRFRVIGPLSNLQEFSKAFACKAADEMVRPPSQQCRVW